MTTLIHLECSLCRRSYDPSAARGMCECGGVLLARYDLENTRLSWSREWLGHAPATMWRYAPLLPVMDPASIVSLGEGMTPLFRARRLGQAAGGVDVWIKDEGLNRSGSVKAGGLSCAVSMAVERAIARVSVCTTPNAAGALAAYAAAAGLRARVALPPGTPAANSLEARACGAEVVCGVDAGADPEWFQMGAFLEPYRVEGAKTLGFEIAEQSRWELPDAIVFPTGSGGGLVGLWKAFEELEALGWIGPKRPRMIAVQAEGCRPLVDAFERELEDCEECPDPFTIAAGMRVSKPLAGRMILKTIRESGGAAVAVTDQQMLDAGLELARVEGVYASPEGAATVAALPRLSAEGRLKSGDRVVLCITASGHKNAEAYATRFPGMTGGEPDKLGGLITPR
jgi:threonine synthase